MHWIASIYRVFLSLRTQKLPSVHALRGETVPTCSCSPSRYAPSHRYRIVAGPKPTETYLHLRCTLVEQLSNEKGLAQGEERHDREMSCPFRPFSTVHRIHQFSSRKKHHIGRLLNRAECCRPFVVYGRYHLLDAGVRVPIIRILFIYFNCLATISYERVCGRYNDRARRTPPQSR